MDGNGRWAKQRGLPRIAGHKAGADAVRRTVKGCAERGIEVVTLFAFSSENWRRPPQEVSYLMQLFITVLKREIKRLHEQNIRLQVIGDRSRFDEKLREEMHKAEALTHANTGLKLVIAANYGGRWDICHAVQLLMQDMLDGKIKRNEITPESIQAKIALGAYPEPDLLIRTSGEQRLSNFMLWQLSYTELYFSNIFWPDFDELELDRALDFFAKCERRFGQISNVVAI